MSTKDFNSFRFDGLDFYEASNKYLSTKKRVSDDEQKVIVKISENHIVPTRYGFALILDYSHVVFLKNWQVSQNYYGTEVLLNKEFFNVKEWGEWDDFGEIPENLEWAEWVNTAKEQQEAGNTVSWKKED